MGRKSTRVNKTIYQIAREEADLTREGASDLIGWMSEDRIEKLESEKLAAHPDDVLAMSVAYKKPELCNLYCARECPIGQKYVPELEMKELGQITLEVVNSLNILDKEKARLIEIAVDGKVTSDEKRDFSAILEELDTIERGIQTLRFWIESQED